MTAICDQIRAFADLEQSGSEFLFHQGFAGFRVEVFDFDFEQNFFDLQKKRDEFLRIGFGVDISEPMLIEARSRGTSVQFVQGDAVAGFLLKARCSGSPSRSMSFITLTI